MRTLILIPLLLLASCTKQEATVIVEDGNSSTAGSSAETSNPDTTPANPNAADATPASNNAPGGNASEKMADQGITSGSKPLIPAQAPAASAPQSAYKPKRTPEFGFEATGSITQEMLTEFYVEMTVAVDGKEVGTMVFDLWPEQAPATVRNFLRYVDEGFYDGLGFHRILRDFMVQGGDPLGTGAGDGPHGAIIGEFSTELARKHGYGVLSMARGGQDSNSGSCQFFVCCSESMDVWSLDGKYASFGMMVKGVEPLEAMASVPVGGPRRQSPMRSVKIVKAVAKRGELPTSDEKIERPAPDLKGEPADITVQHVLISFRETPVKADRSKEEAEALANEILKRARDGEDFGALVKEYSDDNINPKDALPGSYRMLNNGVQALDYDRAVFTNLEKEQEFVNGLKAKFDKKEITYEQAMGQIQDYRVGKYGAQPIPRGQMVQSFGDISFSLKVGEIGVAEYSPTGSKFGWHIIRRVN
jgi:cyclophilin family peptidyl-prolyl cis-trans isomerase